MNYVGSRVETPNILLFHQRNFLTRLQRSSNLLQITNSLLQKSYSLEWREIQLKDQVNEKYSREYQMKAQNICIYRMILALESCCLNHLKSFQFIGLEKQTFRRSKHGRFSIKTCSKQGQTCEWSLATADNPRSLSTVPSALLHKTGCLTAIVIDSSIELSQSTLIHTVSAVDSPVKLSTMTFDSSKPQLSVKSCRQSLK